MEDCSNPKSFRASVKALEIIENAFSSYEEFITTRRWHRDHCPKCKSRGFGKSAIPLQERLEALITEVNNLLEQSKKLRTEEERLGKRYGNAYTE